MAQSKQKYAFRYLSVRRQYMTTHQVAEDMGITTTTLAAWVYRHGMPCRGAGNLFLFDADELIGWIEAQRPQRGRPPMHSENSRSVASQPRSKIERADPDALEI